MGSPEIYVVCDTETAAQARRLRSALGPERCFVPLDDIDLGLARDEVAPSILAAARVTAVIVPPEAGEDWYRREDVARAIDRARTDTEHRVVPIYLTGTSPPSSVDYGLRRLMGLFVETGGWPTVARGLTDLLDRLAGVEGERPAPSAPSVPSTPSALSAPSEISAPSEPLPRPAPSEPSGRASEERTRRSWFGLAVVMGVIGLSVVAIWPEQRPFVGRWRVDVEATIKASPESAALSGDLMQASRQYLESFSYEFTADGQFISYMGDMVARRPYRLVDRDGSNFTIEMRDGLDGGPHELRQLSLHIVEDRLTMREFEQTLALRRADPSLTAADGG